MKNPKPNTTDSEVFLVGQIAAIISIAAFFYYLRHDDLLLYGDAVAHISIARRVIDSRTPGLLQLGTVWLPLPHLLMLPFLISKWMWRTGIAGSIPSMLSYVFSVTGVFRLLKTVLPSAKDHAGSRFAPWFAAAIFAINPNLIYLQTTAMTEAIYLAFFIWTLVFISAAIRACSAADGKAATSSLTRAGFCIVGACLTRYDGWFLAVVAVAVLFFLSRLANFKALRRGVKHFALLAAAGPALWFAYNAAVYRNPLEFANGAYSAKAIEQKSILAGSPPHPGTGNLPVAFQYFFKSAELNLAEGKWQIFWVCSLLLGTAIVLFFQRKLWPVLLLWVPVPFYMVSIAHSSVPLFVPSWWPFSLYNVRYGLEMLPAFAVFTAIAAYGLIRFASNARPRLAIAIVFLALGCASYIQIWRKDPASFQEAVVNSRSRIALESAVAARLEMLPADSTFLMYLGDHVGALQQAGISLSRVINEGNHRPWKGPSDPQGLWERALKDPASYANYVIDSDSDPVASSVNKNELATLVIIRVTGQSQATIYRTFKSNQAR
ncbi:MAG TPA: hypothetical protein VHQ22_10805 [Terriglobales bacterium]|jgi:hypothetical protein|nr:hypothetical protein [Terriglobales bacterium]